MCSVWIERLVSFLLDFCYIYNKTRDRFFYYLQKSSFEAKNSI